MENKKVFIVIQVVDIYYTHKNDEVERVFTTKEKAEKYIDKMSKETYREIVEMEVE